MNFKRYYINGSKFTFEFRFSFEKNWNNFMYFLTRMTTFYSISEHIFMEMIKNPPEMVEFDQKRTVYVKNKRDKILADNFRIKK